MRFKMVEQLQLKFQKKILAKWSKHHESTTEVGIRK